MTTSSSSTRPSSTRRPPGLGQRDPRLREADDGRRFLQRTDERHDVIMVDAFTRTACRSTSRPREFVEPDGGTPDARRRIATNVIGALTGGSSQITRALWKTYAAVSLTVKLRPVFEGSPSAVGRHPEHHPRRHRARGPTDRAVRQLVNETRAARAPVYLTDGGREGQVGAQRRHRRRSPLTDGYAPTDALLIG